MNYEPTLIIRKSQLHEKADELRDEQYNSDTKHEREVAKFLVGMLDHTGFSFDSNKTEFVICQPELTYFNEMVRDKLDEFEVDFRTCGD